MKYTDYTITTRRIGEILTKHSDIETAEIKRLMQRIEQVGQGKPEKMLSYLTGTLSKEYSSEENIIGGLGEMAMYYTNGDEEVATKIVQTSPVGETYEKEYLKHLIVDEWESMGGNTYSETHSTAEPQ